MPKKGAPDVNPLPALTNGYITFGSFHRASKLSRDVVGLWGHLLRAVPDAKMLVGGLTQGSDDTLLGWFDEEGIDRDRLLLRYRAGMNEYLKQHYDVDVALASFRRWPHCARQCGSASPTRWSATPACPRPASNARCA
jgi:predicted O-linked N-acetylglucosamine transferase (SPINDLY family)